LVAAFADNPVSSARATNGHAAALLSAAMKVLAPHTVLRKVPLRVALILIAASALLVNRSFCSRGESG